MSERKDSGIPLHVAIIMDGNGRWARQRGLPRVKGHEAGAESVRAIVRACRNEGIKYLTLYAFSMENWSRPETEIARLMELLVEFLQENEHELHENGIRLRVIGRVDHLPGRVRDALDRTIEATKDYSDGHLTLALAYGARQELVDAVQRIAAEAKSGELAPEDIDEDTIGSHLYTHDLPDPDLLIRTSGEMRVSNFLLWQISYSELYVTDVLWPDFREDEFRKAIQEYARRHRRFGGVGDV